MGTGTHGEHFTLAPSNHNNTNQRVGWAKGFVPGGAPEGLAPSPQVSGLGVEGLGSKSECKSLGLGFGLLGQNSETLKLESVWAKTVKPTTGQSRFGQFKVGSARTASRGNFGFVDGTLQSSFETSVPTQSEYTQGL